MWNLKRILAGLSGMAILGVYLASIPIASASVSLTVAPTSAITSPRVLPANSLPTPLFSFSLNATSGETLSSVSVELDKANSITTVTGNHLAVLAIYKDNGDGVFNTASDMLVGSQSNININGPTVIIANLAPSASGEFFVTLSTSASWTAGPPPDSITATFPANGITTSANSPAISQVTTPLISASAANLAQVTLSQQLSASNVGINQAIYNTASLGNTNGTAGGTVTYNVYLGGTCSGQPTFSDNEPVSFSQAAPSRSFSTTATGTYSWQASYSGDAANTSATSACASVYVGTIGAATTQIVPANPGSLPVTGMTPLVLFLILGTGAALIVKILSLN